MAHVALAGGQVLRDSLLPGHLGHREVSRAVKASWMSGMLATTWLRARALRPSSSIADRKDKNRSCNWRCSARAVSWLMLESITGRMRPIVSTMRTLRAGEVEAQRETDLFERPLMDILGPGQRAAGVADVEIDDSMRERRAVALLGSLELVPQVAWVHPGQQSAWGYETLMDNRHSFLGTAHALTRDDFQFIGDAIDAGSQRQDALDQLAMLRLAQGMLETLLEAELLAGNRLAAGSSSLNNAALAYRNDLQAGSLWKPLRQGDAMSEAQGFAWRPDADMRAHFAAELAVGKHLIMPTTLATQAPGPTWWQLDPVTGDIVGFGPDRRGQFVEAILMLMNSINNALSAVQMVQSIWECLFFDDPECCTKQAAAKAGANTALSGYFASAAKVSNVNFVIGRDIVHGKVFATFRSTRWRSAQLRGGWPISSLIA